MMAKTYTRSREFFQAHGEHRLVTMAECGPVGFDKVAPIAGMKYLASETWIHEVHLSDILQGLKAAAKTNIDPEPETCRGDAPCNISYPRPGLTTDEDQAIHDGISRRVKKSAIGLRKAQFLLDIQERLTVQAAKALREQVLTPNGYQSVQYHQETHRAFDRITPIVRGILTVLKNLQTLCRCCNYLQGAWV